MLRHVLLALGLIFAIPAHAQTAESKARPAAKAPFKIADDLDGLFAQLKRTSNTARASRISAKIWSLWQTSDSRTVDLLTHWARSASSKRKYAAALDLLDQVVTLRPDYAEGWNQRATLHFAMRNFDKSIVDIERTLALEPRHYGALAGLATILESMDRREEALDTWYRALAVYPSMESAQGAVLRLEEDLAGEGI
jgi:tetratricopeptide (TPR) repeat protein